METKTAVDVKNLEFSYGERKVLEQICARFRPGMVCGLLGPNGSGKTTLMKNIAAIFTPHKNAVYLNGSDITSMNSNELAMKISVVPQNTHIEFDFSVQDIVMMGRTPYIKRFSSESEEDIEIAQWAMKISGIEDLAERSIKNISGGELQRVVIARALAQKSNVILLDEPVSQLDIHHQLSIMETIRMLAYEYGMTVVTILHDLNLAAEFCDYIYLLRNGFIAHSGKPKDVLTYEIIEEIYNIVCLVYENPVSKKPHIVPVRSL